MRRIRQSAIVATKWMSIFVFVVAFNLLPQRASAQTDADCEVLKKSITLLQDEIAKNSVVLNELQPLLENLIKSHQKLWDESWWNQLHLQRRDAYVSNISQGQIRL